MNRIRTKKLYKDKDTIMQNDDMRASSFREGETK